MKKSELKAKIKEMIVAEIALDIDNMEDAPESEVDFLAELEGMLILLYLLMLILVYEFY